MSKITALFVIFACLTTAFALNSTLTKNFFFVNTENHLSYKLFHTRNGIIAYNLESSLNGPIPQYLLLDPIKGYATLILQDILTSCGQVEGIEGGVFDRLQYHVQTSTLAYFCTANNSLLILDEDTYAVKETIPTGISTSFSEAKLTADGSFLYVLLTGTLYLENQVPSQLVQIDLATRKIARSVVFDQGLEANEYVNGFVSQNNQAYALTNTINSVNETTTITIYSVTLTGNNYELRQLTNFTNVVNLYNGQFLNQLYQLGDYLVMNKEDNLVFMDKKGNILHTYIDIGSKVYSTKTVSYFPAIVTQEGSSDLYVLLYETLYKFTAAANGTIVSQVIGTAYDFQIAFGNHYTNDLLFTINTSQSNFSITNLENSESVYSVPSSYNDFVITNSTFGIVTGMLEQRTLYVYNRQSNALIGQVSIPASFYLHKESDTLYFSELVNDYTCAIKQLDLITLAIVDIHEYYDYKLCSDTISQFEFSRPSIPEFVALSIDNWAEIVTEAHGIVNFDLTEYANDIEYIVADFATMSLYQLQANSDGSYPAVSYYEYNGTGFTLKNTYDLDIAAVSSYSLYESGSVFAFSDGLLNLIDLESGSGVEYSLPTNTQVVSSFQDNAGKEYFIFSDSRFDGSFWSGNVTQPSLFESYLVRELPGTNSFTVQAGAAGQCSYWVVDGLISSVGLVKFYDACAQDTQEAISMFSILQ